MRYKKTNFFPNSVTETKEELLENLKINKNTSKDEKNIEIYKEILFLVYFRLVMSDKNFKWDLDEYKNFAINFNKIPETFLEIASPSVINCLKSSNKELEQELLNLSKKVDWYPEKDKTKINTRKKITSNDAYFVIENLVRKMCLQYIEKFIINNIISTKMNAKDLEILIEKYSNDNFYQQIFLIYFDNEFGYLKEFTKFHDVYLNARKIILERLIKRLKIELEKKQQEEDTYHNKMIKK